MTGLDIFLWEEGHRGSSLRAKNLEGEEYRMVYQNQGNHGQSLIARAEIINVTSGTLTPQGEPATLIILRFTFNSLNQSSNRRFVSATIKVEFSDFLSRSALDPEVYKILPDNNVRLDKVTRSKDVEWTVKGGLTSGVPFVTPEVGVSWKMSKKKDKEYWAKLTGTKWNNRSTFAGLDNTAIWYLAENKENRQGIPALLQTAVLLRRKGNDKIQMKINIESYVDNVSTLHSKAKKLFGGIDPEPMDPVNIDAKLQQLRDVDSEELREGSPLLSTMDNIDLHKYIRIGFDCQHDDEGEKDTQQKKQKQG
ncbi:hypothetical protein ACHAPX_009936 [Trichoderma viride]